MAIPSSSTSKPTVLLTVGSTSFTPLVHSFLSPPILDLLPTPSYNLAQVGNSKLPPGWNVGKRSVRDGVELEVMRFMNDLEEKVERSTVVVSHAGAGSILSFLRPSSPTPPSPQRRLILVPNDTLMDSHQSDLATEMQKCNLATVCTASTLEETLKRCLAEKKGKTKKVLEGQDKKKMTRILDETLGYV